MESSVTERIIGRKFSYGATPFNDSEQGESDYSNTQRAIHNTTIKIGVVIAVGEGRLDNLRLCLAYLTDQTYPIHDLVIVADGWFLDLAQIDATLMPTIISIAKHEPGKEQPRNIGTRFLSNSCSHVWFVDSDIIMSENALEEYAKAISYNPNGLIYGPYDWMKKGKRDPDWNLHNDPRWEMFRQYGSEDVIENNLGVALGCFSGNLVWNIEQFKRVGGFWNELHMGRCEDGELGLRACSLGVPMSMTKKARGWHVHHKINSKLVHEKNRRDVPMINKRHPWVQGKGLIVTEKDGARFDCVCPGCGKQINTLEIWEHNIDSCGQENRI